MRDLHRANLKTFEEGFIEFGSAAETIFKLP